MTHFRQPSETVKESVLGPQGARKTDGAIPERTRQLKTSPWWVPEVCEDAPSVWARGRREDEEEHVPMLVDNAECDTCLNQNL